MLQVLGMLLYSDMEHFENSYVEVLQTVAKANKKPDEGSKLCISS